MVTLAKPSVLAVGLVITLCEAASGALARTFPPMPVAAEDQQVRDDARRGLDLLMDGDPNSAVEIFRQIQKRDPESSVGYLLEGDATWWLIYYSTGDLVDPEVFDVASSETTPYDARFEELVQTAISKSAARIREHQDEARNYLYMGLAYALRARLEGLRGRDLPTARAGKKMRSLSLKALQLDPGLHDAYLGVGLYNYFVDTLPTVVKLLRFLIFLPGGSRELGLQQLQRAAEKGELARDEAKFYLAKDFSRQSEMQYSQSLRLFQELEREYPNNPLWTLLAATLHCRLGQTSECEHLYREVLTKTSDEKGETHRAIHTAARVALERLHPGQKLGE